MVAKKSHRGGEKMKTEYLLNKEVERVLGCLTDENRLVCKVILHTGLRVGDVLALRREDIKEQFWITEAKTGKRRRVGLTRDLVRQLSAISGTIWVFEHRNDFRKHRTRQSVYADVKRAARAYRLKQNVAPHSFRKAYAVDLMEKYGDIERVKRALNHNSVATTTIYALADRLLESKQKEKKKRKK